MTRGGLSITGGGQQKEPPQGKPDLRAAGETQAIALYFDRVIQVD